MGHGNEPSVEEILASIKQVIARDNRAGAADLRRERETRGLAEDDVLDLASSAQFLDEAADSDTDDCNPPLLDKSTQAGISDSASGDRRPGCRGS
mgnify:CR=1 FL=1